MLYIVEEVAQFIPFIPEIILNIVYRIVKIKDAAARYLN